MSGEPLPARDLIDLALEAISDQQPERLRPLLSPSIRIVTERGAHEGIDAALAWATKSYEHLVRRLVLERLEQVGDGLLGSGRAEYVWREGGEVGDSGPAHFAFRVEGGRLALLSLHETESAAIAALGA